MATDHGHRYFENPEVNYEHSDLGHRGVWLFFVFLAISGIVIFLAIGALYKGFGFAEAKLAPPANPMAEKTLTMSRGMMQNTSSVDLQQFSGGGKQPLLQANDAQDMSEFLQQEEMLLKAEPWKEPDGTVHIPIERAMELVSQRSMPVRAQQSNPAVKDPMMVPTESGFAGFAKSEQDGDATMVEGAPMGDTQQEPPKEKERELKGMEPTEPKNPARGKNEHQSASPEQPLKTPPPKQ